MTVETTRKVIGEKGRNYTDIEIMGIINSFTALADLAIDDFIQKRKSKKLETTETELTNNNSKANNNYAFSS